MDIFECLCKMVKSFISLLVVISLALANSEPIPQSTTIGKLKTTYGHGLSLELNGFKGELKAEIGLTPVGYSQSQYEPCGPQTDKNSMCLKSQDSTVHIGRAAAGVQDVECYTVSWLNPGDTLEDCIDLKGADWYGGGELLYQHWPIRNLSQSRNAYVTGDFFHHPYGGVIERTWYSSKGMAIYVEEDTPLFLRFNQSGDGKMCFSASYNEYPYNKAYKKDTKALAYTICDAPNVRQVVSYSLSRWIKKPRAAVDINVIAKPIWSTWAVYKAAINETTVMEYAQAIKDHGFPASHVEIDDKWESCYGQLEFDKVKFPDPAGMVKKVKDMGFGVSFWVHPFVNTDCPAHAEGVSKSYFVRQSASPEKPIDTTWWNGVAGYIDYTNPEAAQWYIDRLKKVQAESGLDTYKFDAGELHWLDDGFLFSDPEVMKRPTLFTQKYTETVSKFGPGVEVRVAYKSQALPIFIRMLDKDSEWGYKNGLKTLIPTALLFSVLGYPFVLPDMIGGNAYGSGLPEKELFIRWLQANVFMPSLQFSITPWQYDKETIEFSKKMVLLHESMQVTFKELSEETVRSGNPIVRPLWWNDPDDPNALGCDSEFLLGDDLLVAPVLDKGAVKRDIYFPRGNWKAQMAGDTKTYVGPTLVKDYSAPLSEVPYFTRV